MSFFKDPAWRSEPYLSYIRTQPCARENNTQDRHCLVLLNRSHAGQSACSNVWHVGQRAGGWRAGSEQAEAEGVDVKKLKPRYWSENEIAVMRERYHKDGLAVMPLLNNRTEMSIRKKAGELGLSDPTNAADVETHWPVPAMDLLQSLACIALRKWRYPVNETTRFGVAMIGGGYV